MSQNKSETFSLQGYAQTTDQIHGLTVSSRIYSLSCKKDECFDNFRYRASSKKYL